ATEVPFQYASGIPDVGRRAANYGMPGFEVDGNDVISVFETAQQAVARARAGEGPTLIECKTYRTRAHAEGMGDFTYRTRDDVEAWKARCPIKRIRDRVGQDGALSGEITAAVREANRGAEQAPWPDPTTPPYVYAPH